MSLDGDKIRRLRIGKGFSQEKLAAMCEISKRTVQRAEKGDAIALETDFFIAEALEVEPEELKLAKSRQTDAEAKATPEQDFQKPENAASEKKLSEPISLWKHLSSQNEADNPESPYRSRSLAALGWFFSLVAFIPILVFGIILLRAAKASLSPSEFLRRSALSAEVVVQAEGPRDFETVDQLRRIGVNLNQLARVANKTGYLPDGLEEALAKVDQLLDRMIEL